MHIMIILLTIKLRKCLAKVTKLFQNKCLILLKIRSLIQMPNQTLLKKLIISFSILKLLVFFNKFEDIYTIIIIKTIFFQVLLLYVI